ncbi:unnamed protein product [Cladocopium goreaui]|uniref:Copia protein n=1 Tax=Cladocopium goreaui TaxID=2562237 RepID=A0A9P1DWN3_9DINO|nr:unnamed protein product [Cladocopium goreaui]
MDDYGYDPDEYDECFASYVDARRRFNELRMSRGFLPVVALDPNASGSNRQPINNKGKGKKGRGKGRGGKNNVKYSKPPMKPHDPKGRAQAALRCLRCGSTSHTTAQCTQGSKPTQKATPTGPNKRQATEGDFDPAIISNGAAFDLVLEDEDGPNFTLEHFQTTENVYMADEHPAPEGSLLLKGKMLKSIDNSALTRLKAAEEDEEMMSDSSNPEQNSKRRRLAMSPVPSVSYEPSLADDEVPIPPEQDDAANNDLIHNNGADLPQDVPVPDTNDNVENLFVEDVDPDGLPSDWHFRPETGYFELRPGTTNRDFWEVKAGCLIRHHVHPRKTLFDPNGFKDIPIPVEHLDKTRVTVHHTIDGQIASFTDDFKNQMHFTKDLKKHQLPVQWFGITVFQIDATTRKEFGMTAQDQRSSAKKVAQDAKVQQKRVFRRDMAKNKGEISEKHLTAAEKELFLQAKVKELQSFFENGVWEFSTSADAIPERTLTSRILLKWSKNTDGTPRAKARLVVRGFNDVDFHKNVNYGFVFQQKLYESLQKTNKLRAIIEANQLLKFAKQNLDLRLRYEPLNALYDSYHKESLAGASSVDKRTGLEIRVAKEQLTSLGGMLRWRIRYHKMKLMWDPEYTSAKKKTAAERRPFDERYAMEDERPLDERYAMEEPYEPVEAYAGFVKNAKAIVYALTLYATMPAASAMHAFDFNVHDKLNLQLRNDRHDVETQRMREEINMLQQVRQNLELERRSAHVMAIMMEYNGHQIRHMVGRIDRLQGLIANHQMPCPLGDTILVQENLDETQWHVDAD